MAGFTNKSANAGNMNSTLFTFSLRLSRHHREVSWPIAVLRRHIPAESKGGAVYLHLIQGGMIISSLRMFCARSVSPKLQQEFPRHQVGIFSNAA